MRKVFAAIILAGLVSSASGGFKISVDGEEDPQGDIYLRGGETATLGVVGADNSYYARACWLFVQGPGSISGGTMLYPGSLAEYMELEKAAIEATHVTTPEEMLVMMADYAGYPGLTDLGFMNFADGSYPWALLEGLLLDDVVFRCEGEGDVFLTLADGNKSVGDVFDTQVIHQIGMTKVLGFEDLPAGGFASYTSSGVTFGAGGADMSAGATPSGGTGMTGGEGQFQADISAGATYVSVELDAEWVGGERVFLEAFNSQGVSVGSVEVVIAAGFSGPRMLELGGADIAYARFGDSGGAMGGTLFAESFEYAPIPEPGSILLMLFGAGLLFGRGRNRTA